MNANASRPVLSKICFALALVPFAAVAQAPTPAAPSSGGVKADIVKIMDDAQTKLTRLADVIPAAKYTAHPVKGSRSVSEVFLHVAVANYFISSKIGTEMPAGIKREDFEKPSGDKAKVMDTMKQSFEHAKQAVTKLTDADLEKTVKWVGGTEVTYRYAAMIMTSHQHEHLGQAIAYTRALGMVPPWTEEQQKAAKAKPKT